MEEYAEAIACLEERLDSLSYDIDTQERAIEYDLKNIEDRRKKIAHQLKAKQKIVKAILELKGEGD